MSTTMRGLLASTILLILSGCPEDNCGGIYDDCAVDEECHPAPLPPGKCLDDRATGRTCALYHDGCPLKLRWSACAGRGEKKSPLAGLCVRQEYLPDLGTDAADADAPPQDMSASSDGGTHG